jgi:EAL domain-containing protein (putative c-di-GMP-specific phosphodiesterase class I)
MVEPDYQMQKYMSLADVALRMAKEDGKNRVICLLQDENTAADIEQIEKTNNIISNVKNALKNDKFILYLQPIVELGSNTVSHYEALIRLKDEDNKFIPPSDFIPIAEKFGFISEIDKWVFKTVLNILKDNPQIKIFINLSAISLTDKSLLEFMEENLNLLQLNTTDFRLGIEITETAASKNFSISESWINKFKKMGCLIAIDDFGVGYTSFSYLRSLPVDYIKIDGSLIKNIDSDKDFEAIVQAINTLGEVLDKKIIAEYVENDSVLDVLKKIGIFYGQGYFLGLPAPLKEYI